MKGDSSLSQEMARTVRAFEYLRGRPFSIGWVKGGFHPVAYVFPQRLLLSEGQSANVALKIEIKYKKK